jgi:predicted Zn-dependent peptidase
VAVRQIIKAALCAAFAFCFTAAAPVSDRLPGGGRIIVVRTDSSTAAAVALWYRAPSSGFETTPVPGIARLAAATVAASTPITGTPLGRYVESLGGKLAVTSYPNSVAISALVPADRAADVVRAMTVSYFAPVVTDAGLVIARRDMAEEALYRQFSPEDTLGDALGAALFADGPARYPSLAKPGDLGAISAARVKAYAERAFRPANAVLVVTGAVGPEVAAAAVPGRSDAATGQEPSLLQHPVAQPAPVTTMGSERGVGLGWIGPAIADEREATALDFITDYLFRPETGTVQRSIGPTKAAVTGKFVTYHDPGIVLITISGGNVDSARAIVDGALAGLRKPLDPATFAAARAAFEYHMLSDIQTPGELADTFGWYTVEGNPDYAPGAGGTNGKYFAAASGLTPAFVAATVAKYLDRPGAVVAASEEKK